MTETTAAEPINLLRGIAHGVSHAIRLTKEGRTAEATEHVDAIDRLTAAYRAAVGQAERNVGGEDRRILRSAPADSDDWDDETWAAWWRAAERAHRDGGSA